ncbi:LysR substrate-binding domain-containing protein [Qingshengfaniella alkalisoli]|uniref:LysR family transcriptional regulator n=1 Tax=Qingshengfaniella alkalisoli TaxID=2599296 RepID=A0A5B8IYG9_9RHOB|nr:LysR substrate-binding domain-containing protein [Qingshengfaniella alkalisoli]QDY70633.1 LysR family transcriptional regulator [Qingshengfaniella alkalisoli]
MLTLRHYELLIVLAEELHFGRASERLHISQPQLTLQLKQMEELIGTTLFERNRRKVTLAAAGELLLPEARAVLRHAARAEDVAIRAGKGMIGELRIGYIGAAAYNGVLTKLVRSYRDKTPDTQLTLSIMDLDRQVPEVAAGNLDAGIVRLPYPDLPDNISVRTLCQERLMLALSEEHKLALSDAPINLSSLEDEFFVATHLPPNTGFSAAMHRACAVAGISPNIVHRSPQFASIISLVAARMGIAIVPEAIQHLCIKGVVYRPLADVDVTANISLVHQSGPVGPALELFLSCLDETTFDGGHI